jgi:hypothetical protein
LSLLVLGGLVACGNSEPDQIAFASDRDGDFEVFVMDADGTNVVSQIRKVRIQNLSHKGFV